MGERFCGHLQVSNDTWGFKTHDHNWKTREDLIRKLVDVASKGGNYLLNIGPTAAGAVLEPSVERLRAMGTWLQQNGEAVYGTRPGPIQGVAWCRSTERPGAVYLHVFDWPTGGTIHVFSLPHAVTGAYLLADPEQTPLPMTHGNDGFTVHGPAQAPDAADSVVALMASI
jgi:alpha-L-fucosidase